MPVVVACSICGLVGLKLLFRLDRCVKMVQRAVITVLPPFELPDAPDSQSLPIHVARQAFERVPGTESNDAFLLPFGFGEHVNQLHFGLTGEYSDLRRRFLPAFEVEVDPWHEEE